MVLEWLRRHDGQLDVQLRNYLFTETAILEREAEIERAEAATAPGGGNGALNIGSLREKARR